MRRRGARACFGAGKLRHPRRGAPSSRSSTSKGVRFSTTTEALWDASLLSATGSSAGLPFFLRSARFALARSAFCLLRSDSSFFSPDSPSFTRTSSFFACERVARGARDCGALASCRRSERSGLSERRRKAEEAAPHKAVRVRTALVQHLSSESDQAPFHCDAETDGNGSVETHTTHPNTLEHVALTACKRGDAFSVACAGRECAPRRSPTGCGAE